VKIRPLRAPKQQYLNSEISASEYIPYQCHWDNNTIMLKDGSLMRVVKVNGFSFETADDEDIDIKKQGRNNLFKGMASGNFALWFHTVRRREKAFPSGEMSNIFTKKLDDEWKAKHSDDRTFVNEHYISIIRKEDKSGLAFFGNLAKKIRNTADKLAKDRDIRESFDELEELTERIMGGFANYGPELLGIVETEDGYFSEILSFLGMIINCGSMQRYKVVPSEINKYLPTNRIYFGPKTFEIKTPRGSKYGGVVSLKEYRPATNAGLLDGFLQLPFEFIISQSFSFINRMIAISSMQLQQRRLVQSEDVAVSQIQEIDEALDSAMSGFFAFGHHHLTITCVEDSIKTAENALSMLVVELANVGITGVREKINMEAAFWSQLPGNFQYIVRKSTVNTLNLASFVSFHNYPFGKRKGNYWGNAVSVFNTVSGTPYFFSFHVRDVGHTMIVGPTGSGKTVIMNFLCAQAQKFKCRMFFFDKDRGAEIFIRALGGKYTKLEAGRYSGFNPLTLPGTSENKSFLIDWIKSMVSINDEIITSTDIARITEAIDGNYKLPFDKRRLRNIAPFLGLSGPGTLAGRLEMWHTNESHSKLFDNKEDEIDFFSTSAFGFDMTELLKDKISIGPVLLYLFHRINQSLDGTPTIIVLDEAWALIDNPIFAPRIKNWLKILRKLNAFVVFATQSIEDATKSEISDTLVQQTATQIYLPNLKATEAYRKIFMLSEREFQLVKTTDPGTRFFLIKQDKNGVVARIDLTGMDDIVRILSGRVETVQLLDEIIKEVGSDDPEDWIEIFYKRARKI
jgi:type IV secretion system protein VirB4